jgi:hypothetical protein
VSSAGWSGPPLETWSHAWTPWEVAARLGDIGVRWWVAAGWAIELAFGERDDSGLRHRDHEDVEIEVLRTDWPIVRDALGGGFAYHPVGDGEILAALADGETPTEATHQTWVEDVDAQVWRMDVMLQPGSADEWVYRRDESFRAPRTSIVTTTADGIPYLLPHVALFYKAKGNRPKDVVDLDAMLPLLTSDERRWLLDALTRFHPEHAWLARLE